MKVAQVMAGAPVGGAELFFERLVAALHRAGDTVLPVIRRDRDRAGRLSAAGLAPVELAFRGRLDLVTRPRLAAALRRFRPRVVVAWMQRAAWHAPRGDYALVGRFGGYYDLSYFRHCDHLVGNTRGMVDWITAQGFPAARTHLLPNFAPDLAGAPPAALGLPPGARVLLALGRLHPHKAYDVLIRALAHLPPGCHAVIAGEGPERPTLEALARREGVADRLHLLGWRTDTAALLAAAEVLVCPSREEALGNVVLEAFSARRPVVAAAVGGPAELVRDRTSGILVPPEDPRALADGVLSLLGDGVRAAAIAAAGRASFEREHGEAAVLRRWQSFLARVAG